jgi:putative transposase
MERYYLFKHPKSVQPNFMNLEGLLAYYEGTNLQKKERYCKNLGDRAPAIYEGEL